MKAMILAAGLGTRLKPITDSIPKALVEINGVPILQHVILFLKSQGFNRLVVNVHHFANQIKEFLYSNDFGVEIIISDESEALLDTGGGIVNALPLLFKNDNTPALIHNVDIISNASDLKKLINKTEETGSGASLLVSDRESSRKLLFDPEMNLAGWHDLKNNQFKMTGKANCLYKEYAFSGIYTISREAVEEMKKLFSTNRFSVMEYFLNPERKERIIGYEQEDLKLLDIGKPATLSQAPVLLNELKSFLN